MRNELLRKIYDAVESGKFFEHIPFKGEVRDETTDKQCGTFIVNYIEVDGKYVPAIIYALEDRYQICCPMYVGMLAEWIRAGSTGGYHGMEPLGEMGDDDYVSRTRLHGSIKKSIVAALPLWKES